MLGTRGLREADIQNYEISVTGVQRAGHKHDEHMYIKRLPCISSWCSHNTLSGLHSSQHSSRWAGVAFRLPQECDHARTLQLPRQVLRHRNHQF